MKTLNRTMSARLALFGLIAAFGANSADVAAEGGTVGLFGAPARWGRKPSGAAAAKRASRKRKNIQMRRSNQK